MSSLGWGDDKTGNQEKIYGDEDPILPYRISKRSFNTFPIKGFFGLINVTWNI